MSQTPRRKFLLGASALLATPLFGAQTSKVPVVAYVFGGRTDAEMAGSDPKHSHARAFVHRLRDLGWDDGRNITLERHGPGNSPERAQKILTDLAGRNVAVIYAASAVRGTMIAEMAMQATRSIPIVFAGGNDPVALGLVTSLSRPGGNVTGITVAAGPEIVGKRLELLKEIVPSAKTVAFVTLPGGGYAEPARKAAAQLALQLVSAEVNTTEQLAKALAGLAREQMDGLVVGSLGFLGTQAPRLVAFAAERRLPAVYAFPESVEAGGLAYFGIDILDINRRAADYVDRILRGAKPSEVPVELPKKFEVVINLKTARALGIRIPQSLLLRADRVIE